MSWKALRVLGWAIAGMGWAIFFWEAYSHFLLISNDEFEDLLLGLVVAGGLIFGGGYLLREARWRRVWLEIERYDKQRADRVDD